MTNEFSKPAPYRHAAHTVRFSVPSVPPLNAITVILFTYLLLLPLVPLDYARLYAIFLTFVFVVQAFLLRQWVVPSSPILGIFLIAEAYALVFHIDNVKSLVNVGSSVACFGALYLVIWKATRRYGMESTEHLIFIVLCFTTALMFPASTFLTAVHYPGAPSAFFWHVNPTAEAASRLILMRGTTAAGGALGGSDDIWSFGFALLLNEKFRRGARTFSLKWFGHMFVLVVGTVAMVAMGARIALVELALIFLLFLAYRNLLGVKAFALIVLAMVAGYLILAFSLTANIAVDVAIQRLQGDLPQVRLSGGSGGQEESGGLLSYRATLNRSLVDESSRHPIIGEGHEAPMLRYGISKGGDIADSDSQKAANSESGLRLIVAYGYPYFVLQMLFMGWPLWRAIRNRGSDPKMSCAVAGVVLLTFVIDGAFDNWYSVTLILGMMTILYSMDDPKLESPASLPFKRLRPAL